MKLKLTSNDGAETTIEAANKLEFILNLAEDCQDLDYLNDLFDIFMEAFNIVSNNGVYKHRNPMNPDENFDLELDKK
jgi:DTW domain-containing protein YfiP